MGWARQWVSNTPGWHDAYRNATDVKDQNDSSQHANHFLQQAKTPLAPEHTLLQLFPCTEAIPVIFKT